MRCGIVLHVMATAQNSDGTPQSDDDKPKGKRKSADGLHNYTVRLSDDDQERLEAAAQKMRRQTGGRESASSLARTFIQVGLQEFERAGGLVISA